MAQGVTHGRAWHRAHEALRVRQRGAEPHRGAQGRGRHDRGAQSHAQRHRGAQGGAEAQGRTTQGATSERERTEAQRAYPLLPTPEHLPDEVGSHEPRDGGEYVVNAGDVLCHECKHTQCRRRKQPFARDFFRNHIIPAQRHISGFLAFGVDDERGSV